MRVKQVARAVGVSDELPGGHRPSQSAVLALSDSHFLARMLVEIETIVRKVVPEPLVLGRVKTAVSTMAKARRLAADVSEIHDKVGIRVIVPSTEQCFAVVNELHMTLDAMMANYDDYITNPKKNGYRALHTTLRGPDSRILEVQVRSQNMHACAESGSAQHRLYKSGQGVIACANY